MSARGADLLVDALAMAGVRHLFSLSGNQILSVYDATVGRDITLIHTRHEAAAVHMADGWARMTEEPGVALVTAGPGVGRGPVRQPSRARWTTCSSAGRSTCSARPGVR